MPATPDDRDERLALILDELANASADGSAVNALEQAVQRHPDLAQEIRELYATVVIAGDIALLQSLEDTNVVGDFPGGSQDDASRPGRPKSHSLPSSGSTTNGDSQNAVATTVIGDYRLLEEVGRGGMGVVYRAYHQPLDRIVALKMIPNAEFAASHNLARLRAEALAAARLNHPHIVSVYEVGEHNGQPWFSMQFVQGRTLSDALADGPMNADDAVRLMIPVVEAIGAAHRAGVLHRDLKPSNILIADDGTAYVTDFGLAKRVAPDDPGIGGEEPDGADAAGASAAGRTAATVQPTGSGSGSDVGGLTQSGAILGTPSWMSPEQASGQTDAIDVTSDIYSLGAILYAALTGRPPFQSASPLDTLLMVLEQDPPTIRMLNPAVDADLEMIVLKCLQKPQDLRYSTTDELVGDLKAWRNREPISARQSTVVNVISRL
ncbi:MAG: serine/threonine protein kinase, partial [Planctomycetaceae bacterium]|nr:serine/threonine protein kinase [Planctomycetaceae bacterium]